MTVAHVPRVRDRHAGLGVAATDAASLIAEHSDAPPLRSLAIEHTHTGPVVRAQLAAAHCRELANLVAYAERFDETLVHLRRYDEPHLGAFTYAGVHTERRDCRVQVWTHPEDEELAALWSQRDPSEAPEVGLDVVIGLDAVRAACKRAGKGG